MPFDLGDPTQSQPEIHVGDSDTQLVLTVYDQDDTIIPNLADATLIKIRFESPAHVVTDKTASLFTDGSDGKIVYITEASLFTMSGFWKAQAFITFGGAPKPSNIVEFEVYANIPAPA